MPLRPTPEMIAAAWRSFRGDRSGMLLGPGPGFVEALTAAMAVDPRVAEVEAEVARLRGVVTECHPFVAHYDQNEIVNSVRPLLAMIDAARRGRAIEEEGKDGKG